MNGSLKFMICEGPVCKGSPTEGSERAYRHLKENGLPELFGDAASFYDYDGATDVPEIKRDPRLCQLETVMTVCRGVYENVKRSRESGYFPVVLGGDHSLVMSSIAAASDAYGAENVAVIYVDAHTDINTENTSPSGMIHGMPLAAAMGLCTDELDVGKNKTNLYGKNLYIIGAHSIDRGEFPIIRREGVHLFTADEVRRRGYRDVVDEVIVATKGMKIHLSFDVDSIKGSDFPATGYALPGSLPYLTVRRILERIWSESEGLVSLDVVEYNPTLDGDAKCLAKMLDIFSIFKG